MRAKVCEARDGNALSIGGQSENRSMATWDGVPQELNPNQAKLVRLKNGLKKVHFLYI